MALSVEAPVTTRKYDTTVGGSHKLRAILRRYLTGPHYVQLSCDTRTSFRHQNPIAVMTMALDTVSGG